VREIEDAKLQAGEDERSRRKRARLEHCRRAAHAAGSRGALLDGGEDGVLHAARRTAPRARRAGAHRPSLARLGELYDAGFYALEELSRELVEYERAVELDPERLAEVQRRRDLLFRLCKKYGPSLGQVLEAGRQARRGARPRRLGGHRPQGAGAREARRATRCCAARRADRAARRPRERLAPRSRRVPDLGMADGTLPRALTPRDEPGPTGAEDVEFRVALNVGHDARRWRASRRAASCRA
jgi:DNA repair protein RecN (Recombination protein N)